MARSPNRDRLGMVDDDPDRLARITATALAYLGADHDWRVGVKP